MKRLFLALSVFLAPVTVQAETNKQELSLKVVEDYLIPAYQDFAKAADEQLKTWSKTCDPEALKPTYQKVADKWATVQHINFGPVTLLLRRDRLYHWPERRNAVSKGLNKLISKKDPEQLKLENFSYNSVAVQGLPALERVLYTDLVQGDYSCQLGKAIAANIAEIANGTVEDWGDTIQYIKDGKEHPIYFTSMDEVALRLFTELLTGFQIISDQKLALPLGSSITKANGKRAEAWRSDRSTRYLQENARGIIKMTNSFMAFLPKEEQKKLALQLAQFNRGINSLPISISKAVSDEGERAVIMDYKDVHRATRDHIFNSFTKHLGLTVGFNSLDGD